jgi:hypothetical protein
MIALGETFKARELCNKLDRVQVSRPHNQPGNLEIL